MAHFVDTQGKAGPGVDNDADEHRNQGEERAIEQGFLAVRAQCGVPGIRKAYGAVLALESGASVEGLDALLTQMKMYNEVPLQSLSNVWQAIPQKMVEIESTRPVAGAPEGMVAERELVGGGEGVHRRGFERVNLGRSRPFFRDGVLQFKRSLGARLTRPTSAGLVLTPLRATPGVLDFLGANPFIGAQGPRLHGYAFALGSGPPASATTGEELSRFPGLASFSLLPVRAPAEVSGLSWRRFVPQL